jgi:hypothetical protein
MDDIRARSADAVRDVFALKQARRALRLNILRRRDAAELDRLGRAINLAAQLYSQSRSIARNIADGPMQNEKLAATTRAIGVAVDLALRGDDASAAIAAAKSRFAEVECADGAAALVVRTELRQALADLGPALHERQVVRVHQLALRAPNQSHVRTRPQGSRELEMHAQTASVDGDARSLCEQLLARHHNNVDRGRATSSLLLFAPDAELTVPGGVARGAGEIETMLQHRERDAERRTLHAVTGFDFSRTSPREAAAEGGIALYVGSAERVETVPQSLLRFQAAFRCDDGGWRIASLHLKALGAEGR